MLRYDQEANQWTCTCSDYKRDGKCKHTRLLRRSAEVKPDKKYL